MSENVKNIETCRGEDVLAEVSALPQDPHFGSLVNEALDPLKQQALHQAGYDGYSEVIEQHKPYTFASAIIQMKSNLLLLLRALWQFPFGSGTLRSLSDDASLRSLSDDAPRSLADMWSHYIHRLSGNPEHGIPSRLSSLTDLPSAPLLLADRKISEPNAIDGISLVHLLCDSTVDMTEFEDTNYDWTFNKSLPAIFAYEKITLRCKEIAFNPSGYTSLINSIASLTTLEFPELVTADFGSVGSLYRNCANITKISFPELVNVSTCNEPPLNSSTIEEIDMPKLDYIKRYNIGCITGWSAIKKLRVHHPNFDRVYPNVGDLQNMPNLIHLEFGADMAKNIYLPYWNPTNALDASLDTLVTDEDCHNNLEQFLKNFRTYIALRLATFTANGPTLTLSAAVFSSIWDANGNPQVLGDGLDQLRADIHNIVKTTKHWDVNKAN